MKQSLYFYLLMLSIACVIALQAQKIKKTEPTFHLKVVGCPTGSTPYPQPNDTPRVVIRSRLTTEDMIRIMKVSSFLHDIDNKVNYSNISPIDSTIKFVDWSIADLNGVAAFRDSLGNWKIIDCQKALEIVYHVHIKQLIIKNEVNASDTGARKSMFQGYPGHKIKPKIIESRKAF